MAMIRHRIATGATAPMRLLYSSRTIEDVIYRTELDEIAADGNGVEIVHTLTRAQPTDGPAIPAGSTRAAARGRLAGPTSAAVFVCGATSFVEAVADGLVGLGYDPRSVKTERYGGIGG